VYFVPLSSQALLEEMNRLRQEAAQQAGLGESLQQAHKEVSRLRSDVVHHQKQLVVARILLFDIDRSLVSFAGRTWPHLVWYSYPVVSF
jgi:hypothetical protein